MAGHIRKVLGGSYANVRRKPISVRNVHRCWAGAMQTSWCTLIRKLINLRQGKCSLRSYGRAVTKVSDFGPNDLWVRSCAGVGVLQGIKEPAV
jgi:hypothetical protein